MDVHSPEKRSFNMSKIRGKNTRPEIVVRRWLWKRGYRYRLHRKDLAGKPDIVLAKYEAAIFINGCFWHRHGCQATKTPLTRRSFWLAKFEENVKRDRRNLESLLKEGWRVMVIWECDLLGKTADIELAGNQIIEFLNSDSSLAQSRGGANRSPLDGYHSWRSS